MSARVLRRTKLRCTAHRLVAPVLLIALALLPAGAGPAAAAESAKNHVVRPLTREYLIKAAILYNFAKFTNWPARSFEGPEAPLRLCVLGTDPFAEALDTIEGKRVGARRLRVARIAAPGEIPGCHVLFVSESERGSLPSILSAARGEPVLSIAELPDFAQAGGVIALRTVDDRTRFDVNLAAAERSGLRLSAKLLRLATTVIQE